MRKKLRLNTEQVKAISGVLLELGKWLIVAVVLTPLFLDQTKEISRLQRTLAFIAGVLLLVIAVWLLKGVKDNE